LVDELPDFLMSCGGRGFGRAGGSKGGSDDLRGEGKRQTRRVGGVRLTGEGTEQEEASLVAKGRGFGGLKEKGSRVRRQNDADSG
jgi:hypothetical protein